MASPRHRVSLLCAIALLLVGTVHDEVSAQRPSPPTNLQAVDRPWDDGTVLRVRFSLSPDDGPGMLYLVERCGEFGGLYEEVARIEATPRDRRRGEMSVNVEKCVRGKPYWFRVSTVAPNDEQSAAAALPEDAPAVASMQAFDGSRFWLAMITLSVCSSVVAFILLARFGATLKVREIAGLEAIEEAVGRATEMGRSCLFIPGIQDMNDIQTISGLSILSRVAQRAAEYDCLLETPTARSLVMTAARETVETAFLSAGRPDAYNQDNIYYVTDEQFAYVSYLSGKIVREEPAACFYLGAFFAESLILAETGNAVGAIQVAGTAQPAQLPFFVAACDYTLIGEEFFAASAYLSGDPDQLGSLKGQDVGKIIVGSLILVGVVLVSLMEMTPSPAIDDAAHYLTDVILHAGG